MSKNHGETKDESLDTHFCCSFDIFSVFKGKVRFIKINDWHRFRTLVSENTKLWRDLFNFALQTFRELVNDLL